MQQSLRERKLSISMKLAPPNRIYIPRTLSFDMQTRGIIWRKQVPALYRYSELLREQASKANGDDSIGRTRHLARAAGVGERECVRIAT